MTDVKQDIICHRDRAISVYSGKVDTFPNREYLLYKYIISPHLVSVVDKHYGRGLGADAGVRRLWSCLGPPLGRGLLPGALLGDLRRARLGVAARHRGAAAAPRQGRARRTRRA